MNAADDLHERALAGAVVATNGHALARVDGQGDTVERLEPTERLDDVHAPQHGLFDCRRASSLFCRCDPHDVDGFRVWRRDGRFAPLRPGTGRRFVLTAQAVPGPS